MDPKPSLGRVVHLNAGNGIFHTATIAKVWSDECVNLGCLDENGTPYNKTSVLRGGDVGNWNWPTRV